jgi:LemA protein
MTIKYEVAGELRSDTLGGMKNPKRSMACVLVLLLALASSGCGYNSIQGADENVKAAWAEVQNQFQRRMDLIPNLVATVKGAANFEKETLEAVIQARASATQVKMDASVLDDPEAFQKLQAAQGSLGSALSRLLVVSERYPELKATAAFSDLQAQLEGTENRITVARKRYVETVAEYNKLVRFFPTNLTARFILGVEPRPTFEATPGAEKPPEVQF